MKLFIDIETIPTQREDIKTDIRFNISAPANYTKPETIAKWIEENAETEFDKQYRKTALDGLLGEIVSIAWAVEDNEPQVLFRVAGESEADLLRAFFEDLQLLTDKNSQRINITQWIGHYITGFDLRFIWQRCVVNQVKPTVKIPYNAKPWDDCVFDTKVEWSGTGQYSGKSSLDALCKAFGLEGKGDIDGSKVWDYYQAGRIEEIAEYNKEDVIKARKIYNKFNFIK
jgi:predicted PolB exonuclease-like 3'-5' exonuclease